MHRVRHASTAPQPAAGSDRAGFTLIELLIVLGIIAALMALGVVVGRQVTTGNKSRVSEQLITSLDQSVDSFEADKGSLPPPMYSLTTTTSGGGRAVYDFPAIDARPGGTASFTGIVKSKNWFAQQDSTVPSMATYAAILQQSALAESVLKVVPARFVRVRYLDQWYDGTENATSTPKDILPGQDVQSFEVIDPWGRPIRFVHPGLGGEEFFDGSSGDYYDPSAKAMKVADGMQRAQYHRVFVRWGDNGATRELHFRRSYRPYTNAEATSKAPLVLTGDADEGLCPTRRPYFYSAGPDGDPGTRSDNSYSTQPEFPEETATLPETEY